VIVEIITSTPSAANETTRSFERRGGVEAPAGVDVEVGRDRVLRRDDALES
jgi:hypothetical protein